MSRDTDIKRVLITRQPDQSIDMINQISSNEYFPYLLPMIATTQLLPKIDKIQYDIIIFTSTNAVRYFLPFKDSVHSKKYIAVGSATEQAMKDYLSIISDYIPDIYSIDGIKNILTSIDISDYKILIPGAKVKQEFDDKEFIDRGAEFTYVSTYETNPIRYDTGCVDTFLLDNRIDVLTFCSPSAVKSFTSQADVDYKKYKVISIGKTTSIALDNLSIDNIYPPTYTVEELIKLI